MSEEEQNDRQWVTYEVRPGVDKRIRITGPDGLELFLDCDMGGEEFAKCVDDADEIVCALNAWWSR